MLILTVFLVTGCNKEKWFCGDCIEYDFNGTERQYLVHIPNDLPPNAPLLFALHGYTGYALHVDGALNLNKLADDHGFVVCYPQGSLDNTRTPHWNARLELSNTDDIGFLSALAVSLQSEYDLDPNKTFTCGISNGGFMSYTLVAEAPQIFKGAASVIGTMSGYTWENRNSIQPSPILQISGTNDNVVPYDGTMSTNNGWGGAPHIHTVIDFWKDLNNCSQTDTIQVSNLTTAYIHSLGTDSAQVWYYEVEGMGHEVPQEAAHGVDAGELIWEFFSQY
ncbi:MAG: prolyl oligopeptidase family serine peptidase [Flavobacteriales bacterium]|nr:prolyl oligopeptidase family serine peptidase [Flavobacteriales bacterium]MCB9204578.1 prolyl oligopeptidase family serine peptidase [Flavobacteriales bacterium]